VDGDRIMRVNRTYRRRYRYKNTLIILITTVSLFGAAGYASYRFFGNVDKVAFDNDNSIEVISPIETQPKSSDEVKAPVKPVLPNSQEVLLSSVGDCTIGWDDKFSYEGSLAQVFKNSESGYSYFFKNVTDIFKADDITTANLETTFTNATVKASKEYTFKAPPEYAEALTLGSIEGVTIANNHTRDYLDQGLNDTKTALDAKNINYFGEGEKWITNVKGHNFGKSKEFLTKAKRTRQQ
jgi:poly-gamma-glutamate synthesis protein (capsule biosynthesis protein)